MPARKTKWVGRGSGIGERIPFAKGVIDGVFFRFYYFGRQGEQIRE